MRRQPGLDNSLIGFGQRRIIQFQRPANKDLSLLERQPRQFFQNLRETHGWTLMECAAFFNIHEVTNGTLRGDEMRASVMACGGKSDAVFQGSLLAVTAVGPFCVA